MITKLSHATVFVLDQDRAKDFYINKLGFECRDDAPMGRFRWLTVGPAAQPDMRMVLMPIAAAPNMTEAQAASLRALVEAGVLGVGVLVSDDLKRDYEELRAKGVEFPQPPAQQPWGLSAVLKDDSGNHYSIGEPG